MWFPNRSDSNQAAQSQKQAGSLKVWIYEEEEVYYLCSENKGADQLRGYREAVLRLCFRICRLLVFTRGGSNIDIGASCKGNQHFAHLGNEALTDLHLFIQNFFCYLNYELLPIEKAYQLQRDIKFDIKNI